LCCATDPIIDNYTGLRCDIYQYVNWKVEVDSFDNITATNRDGHDNISLINSFKPGCPRV